MLHFEKFSEEEILEKIHKLRCNYTLEVFVSQ